jgi:hypothetical protein
MRKRYRKREGEIPIKKRRVIGREMTKPVNNL